MGDGGGESLTPGLYLIAGPGGRALTQNPPADTAWEPSCLASLLGLWRKDKEAHKARPSSQPHVCCSVVAQTDPALSSLLAFGVGPGPALD